MPTGIYKHKLCCQGCGRIPEIFEGYFNIHHIDYNKQNNNIDNLISLCSRCNVKANFNRDYWERYYSDRVKNKYFYFCNT